ncbi:MAG: peptidoglycan DD-metalloendopeptidase family protein [Desulfobacterales bacterium]|jgi:septal ring factor EnvC (AmiA/AmiB activator)
MPQSTTAPTSRLGILSRSILAIVSVLLAALALQAAEIGVVTVEDLNLRPEPGTRQPPIMQLKKGTEVEIEEHLDGWLKVRHAGRVGYIKNSSDYVRVLEAGARQKGRPTDSVSAQQIQDYRRESKDLKRKIEETEVRFQAFTDREATVLNSLAELDYAIDRARRRVKANRDELVDLEDQIQASREVYKQLVDSVDSNEAYAAKRLTALYKLNRNGTIFVLASSGSIFEMIKRKKYLERILAHDEQVRQGLLEEKLRLKEILDRLDVQAAQKKRLEADIEAQIEKLSRNRTDRSRVLARIRSEKSLQLAAIESMKAAAKTLDQTVDKLAAQPEPQNLAGQLDSFSDFKGLLNMPISGKIVRFFGPQKDTKFNVSVFRSGIDIQAQKGAVIQAVFAGRVLFADWFKGYGNMVIIDHGDGYYTVYAHLEELFKQKGYFVNTGEHIATVGDTASMDGPILHFEVRHHGKPLDPMEWIVNG